METHPVDMEDSYAEADLQSDSTAVPSPQRKRTLDNEPCIPDSTSDDTGGKIPKMRKTLKSLPSYIKRNMVQEVMSVHIASAEGSPQCIVSGASDQREVIEFCHIVSESTPSGEVSDIFLWGGSNAEYLQIDHLE